LPDFQVLDSFFPLIVCTSAFLQDFFKGVGWGGGGGVAELRNVYVDNVAGKATGSYETVCRDVCLPGTLHIYLYNYNVAIFHYYTATISFIITEK
jgi:hypothetical protein